jgi:hypothetical protein
MGEERSADIELEMLAEAAFWPPITDEPPVISSPSEDPMRIKITANARSSLIK